MSKVIVVVGFGPGISSAVAARFGAAGFAVALVGRSRDRLEAGVAALTAKGIKAVAAPGNAGEPEAIRASIRHAREALGPITALHWNAYGGQAEDLMTAAPAAIHGVFDVAIVGLVSAVQEAYADLKAAKGAVLITNGAFGELAPEIDAYAVSAGAMGLAVANAAKNKLTGLLAERLKGDGVQVGQVMVAGAVKGTAWAGGGEGIDPQAIAEKFWALYDTRGAIRDRIT